MSTPLQPPSWWRQKLTRMVFWTLPLWIRPILEARILKKTLLKLGKNTFLLTTKAISTSSKRRGNTNSGRVNTPRNRLWERKGVLEKKRTIRKKKKKRKIFNSLPSTPRHHAPITGDEHRRSNQAPREIASQAKNWRLLGNPNQVSKGT